MQTLLVHQSSALQQSSSPNATLCWRTRTAPRNQSFEVEGGLLDLARLEQRWLAYSLSDADGGVSWFYHKNGRDCADNGV